ncbi:MAG: zinc-binding dehydrogenase [Dehalococcoidia bacterium]|nr:zinc-binding dehydrogenase [Dehalococcoidia bacterium]
MRAVLVDPSVEGGLRLGEAPDPEPRPDQVLVRAQHLALNYGDLNGAKSRPAGFIPGWDASGVVVRAASSGNGPAEGARVVTTMGTQAGWAELRAVDLDELAVVPADIDLAAASTLPIAGVTALRALTRSGALLGRRVLVTGASGGVGRFAVQLAALGGAHVIASVGSVARGEGLRELGATEVAVGLEGVTSPIHVVIDNVGGPQLAAAWRLLGENGVIQCIGTTSGQEASFASLVGMRRSIEAFTKGPRSGADLEFLLRLLQAGRLQVDIGWRGSWTRITEAGAALFGRQVAGKAVLDVD